MTTPLLRRWVDLNAYHAIIDQSKATGAGLALLLVMCRYLDPDGVCRASIPELAAASHASDRAIQKIRARLVVDAELLPIESGGGGRDHTGGYRIAAVSVVLPVSKRSPVSNRKVLKEEKEERESTLSLSIQTESESVLPKKKPPQPTEHMLWPVIQPSDSAAMLEKHAGWWNVVCRACWDRTIPELDKQGFELAMAAFQHIGGAVRVRPLQEKNEHDASFARREFLKYLTHHDPAYPQAVGQIVDEALGPAKLPGQAKAAGARGS